MGVFDQEWNRIVQRILDEGEDQRPEWVYSKYKDGSPAPTRFLLDETMTFMDGSILPITQHKFIDLLKPLREMELFWKWKSNRIEDLHKFNVHIWDAWEIHEGEWKGTIGPSYGYILGIRDRDYPMDKLRWNLLDLSKIADIVGTAHKKENGKWFVKLDQVDYLLQELKNNPGSRYHVTSLWRTEYLDQMALKPCVWSTKWSVTSNGYLNLRLHIRSNDMPLGNPYNVYQYAVLQNIFAHILGYKVGFLKLDLGDAHIYDRQIETAQLQLKSTTDLPEAKLWINPDVTNFYEIDMEKDIKVINYAKDAPVFKYPLAIS